MDLNWRPMFWVIPWAVTSYALLSFIEPRIQSDFWQAVVAIGTLVILFPVFMYGLGWTMAIPDWWRERKRRSRSS